MNVFGGRKEDNILRPLEWWARSRHLYWHTLRTGPLCVFICYIYENSCMHAYYSYVINASCMQIIACTTISFSISKPFVYVYISDWNKKKWGKFWRLHASWFIQCYTVIFVIFNYFYFFCDNEEKSGIVWECIVCCQVS